MLGLGSHIHNPSTQETQAGGLPQVQGSLVNKFQARQGYNQPISKKCIKIIKKTLQAKGDNTYVQETQEFKASPGYIASLRSAGAT